MIQIIPEQEYIRPQKTGDRTNHTENTMTPNDEIKRRDEWEKKQQNNADRYFPSLHRLFSVALKIKHKMVTKR